MNKIISATEARKQFFKVLEEAGTPGSSVTVTLEGRPPVVMMSQEEFEGWQETMEIMADPELMKDIRDGMKDTDAIPWTDVKRKLAL
jgi:prevent-host-death family protein